MPCNVSTTLVAGVVGTNTAAEHWNQHTTVPTKQHSNNIAAHPSSAAALLELAVTALFRGFYCLKELPCVL